MIRPKTIGVLLAAGESNRYGSANKLDQELWGCTLLGRSKILLDSTQIDLKIMVTSGLEKMRPKSLDDFHDDEDWVILHNYSPENGIQHSKDLAVNWMNLNLDPSCQQRNPEVLFLLADMPLVSKSDLMKILCLKGVVVSRLESSVGPPIKLPFFMCSSVLNKKSLLINDYSVFEIFDRSIDIDTPEDLVRVQKLPPVVGDN